MHEVRKALAARLRLGGGQVRLPFAALEHSGERDTACRVDAVIDAEWGVEVDDGGFGMSGSVDPTVVYEEEDGWIVASIPGAPGVFSQGRTREEAHANVLDALQLMTSPEVPPYTAQDWERDNAGRVYESTIKMDAALDEYCALPDNESA